MGRRDYRSGRHAPCAGAGPERQPERPDPGDALRRVPHVSGLRQRWLRVIALGGLAAVAWLAQAKVVESRIEVPVSVQDSYGKRAEQNIHVTLFVDDATPLPR